MTAHGRSRWRACPLVDAMLLRLARLQETYVRMALTGVVVGLAIATVVLLLATMNLIMAILSVGAAAC